MDSKKELLTELGFSAEFISEVEQFKSDESIADTEFSSFESYDAASNSGITSLVIEKTELPSNFEAVYSSRR